MTRRSLFLCGIASLLLLATACEKKKVSTTNPHLLSFRFAACPQAPGIEDIYFTVDTARRVIYNEDSIAYSAKLTSLLPRIGKYEALYSISFNGVKWNESDSIDFSHVTEITTVSGNRKNKVTYQFQLRQHQVDPDYTHWTLHPASPDFTPTAWGLTTDNTRLYLVAQNGEAGGQVLSSTDGNTWTKATAFATSIQANQVLQAGGYLYTLSLDGTEAYRTATSDLATWQSIALPAPATALLGVIHDKVYLTDGSQILEIDEATCTTVVLKEPLPSNFPSRHMAKVSFKDRIFLYGGIGADDALLATALSSMEGGTYWTSIAKSGTKPSFGRRDDGFAVYYLKRVYLFGGISPAINAPVRDVFCSSDDGYSWSNVSNAFSLPTAFAARSGANAVVFNNSIWIAGGTAADDTFCNEVWEAHSNRADFIQQD